MQLPVVGHREQDWGEEVDDGDWLGKVSEEAAATAQVSNK